MITFLIAKFARLGLPEPLRRGFALVTACLAVLALTGLLWTCWLRSHDKAVVAEHELEIAEQIGQATEAANADAAEAAAVTKGQVEAGNKAAQDAAAKSADPLKAGVDALRKAP